MQDAASLDDENENVYLHLGDGYELLPQVRDFEFVSRAITMLPEALLVPLQEIIMAYLREEVLLQSSIDNGISVKITFQYLAVQSEPFRVKLQTGDVLFTFPFSTDSIQLMVRYVQSHKLQKPQLITKPIRSAKMSDNTRCVFDVWFADQCDTKPLQLDEVLNLANFLAIDSLMDLMAVKFALKVNGLLSYFGVKDCRTANVEHLRESYRKAQESFSTINTKIPHCSCPFH